MLLVWAAKIIQYPFPFKKNNNNNKQTTTAKTTTISIPPYDFGELVARHCILRSLSAEPTSSHHGDRKEEKAPDERANRRRGSGCLAVWADVIGGGIHSAISEVRRLAITHRLHHCVAFVYEFASMCVCMCVASQFAAWLGYCLNVMSDTTSAEPF